MQLVIDDRSYAVLCKISANVDFQYMKLLDVTSKIYFLSYLILKTQFFHTICVCVLVYLYNIMSNCIREARMVCVRANDFKYTLNLVVG
jgi:hypothetical protein